METLVQAGSLRPRVEVAWRSDPGRDPDKQVNEDAFAYRPTPFGHLLVVCDGMGGHHAGEEASNLALHTIIETVESSPLDAPPRAMLAHAIRMANEKVYGLAGPDVMGRPGSTIVLALVQSGGALVAHVGDSRCYLLRQGHALALTKDHSVVQQMVDQGMLTPEQAIGHPDANRILRALGVAPTVDVDVRNDQVPFAAGDTFLLCSDGLTDLVTGPEIARVIHESPAVEQAAARLVDLANERGGHDNITVLVARVHDDTTMQAGPTIIATQPEGTPQPLPGAGQTMPPQQAYVPAPPNTPPHGLGPMPASPPPHAMQPPTSMQPQVPPHMQQPITMGQPMAPQMMPPLHQPPVQPTSGPSLHAPISGPHAAIPDAAYSRPSIPPSRSPNRKGSETGLLVAGLVLAALGLLVLGGIGFVLWSRNHPRTKAPAFVDASAIGSITAPATSAPPATLDSATPTPIPDVTPDPTPLPTLTPAPSSSTLHPRGRGSRSHDGRGSDTSL